MEGHTKFLGWGFALALIFHWLVLQTRIPVEYSENLSGTENAKNEPIEVESIPPQDRRPVVQTSKPKDSGTDEEKAKFFGEFKNRVKKEMQSTLKGNFQQGELARGEGGDGDDVKEDTGEEGVSSSKPGKAGELGLKDLMTFARSPHALPKEIVEGTQTLLNTDKVLYASFINRIAEEIYDPWVQYGQSALKDVLARGRKLDPNLFVTKLAVTMNQSGEVTAMTVLQSCGLQELDEAPKKAFWRIARFPNPPSQLYETDGYIRLTYEFQFEWKSSGFNIVPWQI